MTQPVGEQPPQPPQMQYNFTSLVQPRPVETVIGFDIFTMTPNDGSPPQRGVNLIVMSAVGMQMFFLSKPGFDEMLQNGMKINQQWAVMNGGLLAAPASALNQLPKFPQK